MRKLLSVLGDLFLFSFLIVIFILPILVSFNLDPKVYTSKSPQVAGVSNDRKNTPYSDSNYTFNEILSSTDGIIVTDSDKVEDTYEVKAKLVSGYKSYESLSLGEVINNSSETLNIQIKLYLDEDALKGSIISANMNNEKIELFDGDNSFKQIYSLDPNESVPIEFEFNFPDPIYFESFVKLEINFLNE